MKYPNCTSNKGISHIYRLLSSMSSLPHLDMITILLYYQSDMIELKYIHFAVYALVFTIYGSIVTAVGPIIIYFSKVTSLDETYFSFIFLARAGGYLVGGSIVKVLTQRFKYHHLMVTLIIIAGVSLIVSSMDFGFMNLTITMLLVGACCCMLNVLSNLCIFQLFVGEKQDYWIQLINLFFGIGGLIGPVFVIYFEEMAMKAIGVVFFFVIIPFLFLHSPETIHNQETLQEKSKKKELPRHAEICICFLFFFYIAEQVGYAGWIPTYALKAGVADEQRASALASLFWIVNTIARIVLLYLSGSVADRLSFLLKCLVASTFLVLVAQYLGYLLFVSYAGVISSGIFLSAMYALFFSMAQDVGYALNPSNTANFAMCASLGEGLLVMPIGYAMGIFGFRALIFIIFFLSALMYIIFSHVMNFMHKDIQQKDKELMRPLNDIK